MANHGTMMTEFVFLDGLNLKDIFQKSKLSLNLNEILITLGSTAVFTLFGINKRERNERRLYDVRESLQILKLPHNVNQQ